MGPELLGKGGRTSSQAAHCEHDSPEHEVGTFPETPENAVSPDFPSLVAKGQRQNLGVDPMLEEDICCRGTVSRSPRSHPPAQRMAGAVVGITSSHCTPAWQGNHSPREELQTPLGLPTSKRCGRSNAISRAGCCQASAGCWM